MKKVIVVLFIISINGCAMRSAPAPIVNATSIPSYVQNQSSNNVLPSSATSSGSQTTTLGSVGGNKDQSVTSQVVKDSSGTVASADTGSAVASQWIMPTNGRVIHKFTPERKGIDFTGTIGQPIYAVNNGKVVYSGNGLKGYGNLVIIKHDNNYLSAYAHNQTNLVKEGDMVKRGQQIATMGSSDDGQPLLHLEIRQSGKPLNPFTLINQ